MPRDIDASLDDALRQDRAVLLIAERGAGTKRTVYEALNRTFPDARLLVAARPGRFDPARLLDAKASGEAVLWIDELAAHAKALGDALWDGLGTWLKQRGHRMAATHYGHDLASADRRALDSLGATVLRLESELSVAEREAMRGAYGETSTTASIGSNPPLPASADPTRFSGSVRGAAKDAGLAPVTASALAHRLQGRHPEYAHDLLGKAHLDEHAGDPRPADAWLGAIAECYDRRAVAGTRHQVIDGRLALAALAALDEPLSAALGEPLLAALRKECELQPAPPAPPIREHVRWLTDEPVGLDGDELGRHGVATALLAQLKTLVGTYPDRSFLVHVDGPWGAGKSTLLRFLQETAERPDDDGSVDWMVVSYDAWRQSRVGPPWLTLLQAVRTGVRDSRTHLPGRAWFWLRERVRLVDRWHWLALAVMAAVVAVVSVVLLRGGSALTLGRSGDLVKVTAGVLSLLGTVWVLAKSAGRFVSLDSRRAARTFLDTRTDPMEDLAAHFAWLRSKAKRPVLLLVDDVDRCPEAFVVELLDAVQKLMRDRGTSKGDATTRSSLVVVVAADGRWVRTSYDNAYASLAGAVREPGATVGSLFLEKMFQLTVPVPMLSDELKEAYLRELLADGPAAPAARDADPELIRKLSEAPHDQVLEVLAGAPALERVKASALAIDKLVTQPAAQHSTRHALQPYAALLDPTPRAMKRFVMAYSMLRAVRTAEGSVVSVGPLSLWTVVATRWPMLAGYLQAYPEAVVLFAVPAGRIPATVPAELLPLFTDPSPELRAVMNHPDGPLDARTIRFCTGQAPA